MRDALEPKDWCSNEHADQPDGFLTAPLHNLAGRCQHPTDPDDVARRCGRTSDHPIHDPLGDTVAHVTRDQVHPYDPAPVLTEDGPVIYDPDDGEGW